MNSRQVSLPVKMRGLGVRRVPLWHFQLLLASAAGALPIQYVIIGTMSVVPDTACDSMGSTWRQFARVPDLTGMPGLKQLHYDRLLLNEVLSSLEDQQKHPRPRESKCLAITACLGLVVRLSARCSRPKTGRRDREGG